MVDDGRARGKNTVYRTYSECLPLCSRLDNLESLIIRAGGQLTADSLKHLALLPLKNLCCEFSWFASVIGFEVFDAMIDVLNSFQSLSSFLLQKIPNLPDLSSVLPLQNQTRFQSVVESEWIHVQSLFKPEFWSRNPHPVFGIISLCLILYLKIFDQGCIVIVSSKFLTVTLAQEYSTGILKEVVTAVE